MAKCLITKLKGIVDNPYLLKIGETIVETGHRIGSQDIPANRKIIVTYKNVDKTLRCIVGNFVDENDQDIGTTINITKNTKTTFYVSNDSIYVLDCKDISFIDLDSSRSSKLDITPFFYASEDLIDIFLPYQAYGNVSVFRNFTKFRYFNIWHAPNVIGDIGNFVNSDPNIFTAGDSGISGDLYSIKDAWHNCNIGIPPTVTYTQATYDQLISQGCTISGGTLIE